MALYRFAWPSGQEGRLGIAAHKKTSWDPKTQKVRKAQPRRQIEFHDGIFETDDHEIAAAILATAPAKRGEIKLVSETRPEASGPIVSFDDVLRVLAHLRCLPVEPDDSEWTFYHQPPLGVAS